MLYAVAAKDGSLFKVKTHDHLEPLSVFNSQKEAAKYLIALDRDDLEIVPVRISRG
ncbi:MAG: hypothetical protein ACRC6V_13340 [Bacteroidales bacterium]